MKRSDLQSGIDRIFLTTLRPFSAGVAAIMLILTASEIVIRPEQLARPLGLHGAVTALAFLGLHVALRRGCVSARWSHGVAAGFTLLILLKSLTTLALVGSPQLTLQTALLALCSGCLFLSVPWLSFVLFICWAGWSATVALTPRLLIPFDMASVLYASMGMSFILQVIRVRVFRRLERFRIENEAQKNELGEALSAVQESEKRYRRLIDGSPVGIVVHTEGKIVFANPKAIEFAGAPSEEQLLGEPVLKLVHPDFRELVKSRHSQILDQREDVPSVEMKLLKLDGSAIDVEIAGAPILFKGRPAVQVTYSNITERKRMAKALIAREQEYRQIVENANDMIYRVDTQGFFTYVNPVAVRKFGFSEDELLGKHYLELVREDYRERAQAKAIGQHESRSPSVYFEFPALTATGEVVWVGQDSQPIFEDGEIVTFQAVCRDITARRGVEQSLKQTHRLVELLQKVAMASNEASSLDRAMQVALNEVCEATGWPIGHVCMPARDGSDDLQPTGLWRMADSERFDAFRRATSELRFGPGVGLPGRVLVSGRPAWFISPDRLPPGESERLGEEMGIKAGFAFPVLAGVEVAAVIEFFSDVAVHPEEEVLEAVAQVATQLGRVVERQRGEEARQVAARMEATERLAGGIAHDFNNLMAGVLGNAELCRLALDDDHECMARLRRIEQTAERAGELAQQMLAYARGGKYRPVVLNINDIVRSLLDKERPKLPAGAVLESELADDLWSIKADRDQMSQVVMNLLINAAEAIGDEGRITISTRNAFIDEDFASQKGLNPGPHVCLAVQDAGCGMTDEALSKVFDPFFTTKFQGRGLGLAASHGIIKNHEGHISVFSEQDRGSTFEIYVPSTESLAADKAPLNPLRSRPDATVLVVDDEPMVLEVTADILMSHGYRVLTADDGAQAVKVAESYGGKIDLVLLDMCMPVMTGSEAYPLLTEARPDMKIIICSGYDREETAEGLLQAGATAFVEKPYHWETLERFILTALDEQSAPVA